MAVLSGPNSHVRGGPHFFTVTPEGVSGKGGGKGSTMDAPVRISPPGGVPSEAVAESDVHMCPQEGC